MGFIKSEDPILGSQLMPSCCDFTWWKVQGACVGSLYKNTNPFLHDLATSEMLPNAETYES